MNSFILFSFFYLVNIGFKIKADDYNKIININCGENYYFYSINHTCLNCSLGKVYDNICYSGKKSIYGLPIESLRENCTEDEILTELDEEGKHLGQFMCAKKKQDYPDGDEQIDNTFNLYYYQDIRRPESGASQSFRFGLREFERSEINYADGSCKEGQYEKSCQYLANLCALSMYDSQSYFCKKIFEFEKDQSM
jgi:hypothetical protein